MNGYFDYDSGDRFADLMGSLYGRTVMCKDCELEEALPKQSLCQECAEAKAYEENEIMDEIEV